MQKTENFNKKFKKNRKIAKKQKKGKYGKFCFQKKVWAKLYIRQKLAWRNLCGSRRQRPGWILSAH